MEKIFTSIPVRTENDRLIAICQVTSAISADRYRGWAYATGKKTHLLLMLFMLLISSCGAPELVVEAKSYDATGNLRLAATAGELVEITVLGQKMRVTKKDRLYYLHKDIIIPDELVENETPIQIPQTALLQGTHSIYKIKPWPNNVVRFYLNGDTDSKSLGPLVMEAIGKWNNLQTGISFELGPWRDNDKVPANGILEINIDHKNPDDIFYTTMIGFPGEKARNVKMVLGSRTSISSILHQMMHVVGVGHESQRSNRDQFIGIDQTNAPVYNIGAADLISDFLNTEDYTIFNDEPIDTFQFDYKSITMPNMPKLLYGLNTDPIIEPSETLTEKDINLVRKIANYNRAPELSIRFKADMTPKQMWIHFQGGSNYVTSDSVTTFTYDPEKKRYIFMGKVVHFFDTVPRAGDNYKILFLTYPNKITYRTSGYGDTCLIMDYYNNMIDNYKFSPPFLQWTRINALLDGWIFHTLIAVEVEMPDQYSPLRTVINFHLSYLDSM